MHFPVKERGWSRIDDEVKDGGSIPSAGNDQSQRANPKATCIGSIPSATRKPKKAKQITWWCKSIKVQRKEREINQKANLLARAYMRTYEVSETTV